VSEPDIIIRGDSPYHGCEKYYMRLLEAYGPHPVILLNMLRLDPQQKEQPLSEVRTALNILYNFLIINFDISIIKNL
jgi:hypothetical protein